MPNSLIQRHCPSGWSSQDIGGASPSGSADESGGTFTVNGGGSIFADSTSDAGHFVCISRSDNFEMIGRITSVTMPGSTSRSGVMVRKSLDSGSQTVFSALDTGGTFKQYLRPLPDVERSYEGTVTASVPTWFRIRRYENKVMIEKSSDGQSWSKLRTQTLPGFSAECYAGFFVSSDTASTAELTVDSVSVSPLTLERETTWIANTYTGGNYHVGQTVADIYVDPPTGKFYVCGDDEREGMRLYDENGLLLRSLDINSERLAGDGTYLYYSMSDAAGVERRSLFGVAPEVSAFTDANLIDGIAVGDGTLYAYDSKNNSVRTADAYTMQEQSSFSAPGRLLYMDVDPAGRLWAVQAGDTGRMYYDAYLEGPSPSGSIVKVKYQGLGDYLEFDLEGIMTGNYDIEVSYYMHGSGGQIQMIVNGAAVGSPVDVYAASNALTSYTFNNVNLPGGTSTVRFKAVGANAASTGFNVGVDWIKLSGTAPVTFEVESVPCRKGTEIEAKIYRFPVGGTTPDQVLSGAELPRGISFDAAGNAYISDYGSNIQQVLIYDLNGNFVKAFGAPGGVYSSYDNTLPGEVHPYKLNHPIASAVNANGELYVACNGPKGKWNRGHSGTGAEIRKYNNTGSLQWDSVAFEIFALEFVDSLGADDTTDAMEIYSKEAVYTFDYSKPVGQQWTYKAFTYDPYTYPNDPRIDSGIDGTPASARIVYLEGKKYLFITAMGSNWCALYRFEAGREIAVPCMMIHRRNKLYPPQCPEDIRSGMWLWVDADMDGAFDSNEFEKISVSDAGINNWQIDAGGDIWVGNRSNWQSWQIMHLSFQGLMNGVIPSYSASSMDLWDKPAEFTDLCRVFYDAYTDTLFVGGLTPEYPDGGIGSGGNLGTVINRYDDWLQNNGQVTPTWSIEGLPHGDSDGHAMDAMKSMDVEGDYLFVVKQDGGDVWIYELSTGTFVKVLEWGPEVAGGSMLIDVNDGLSVHLRSNGEYVILVEDDCEQCNVMMRWNPGTGPVNNPPLTIITSPLASAVYTEPASVYVLAEASDSDGSIDNVQFFLNGSFVKQENNAPYEANAAGQDDPALVGRPPVRINWKHAPPTMRAR